MTEHKNHTRKRTFSSEILAIISSVMFLLLVGILWKVVRKRHIAGKQKSSFAKQKGNISQAKMEKSCHTDNPVSGSDWLQTPPRTPGINTDIIV
jgi:hypothetical protein